ncbi:MAG: hypothetical protein K8U03_06705 [Planctomycetia bacterium]|nr:hypothetical protein [Planctomycetia bacterium]
MPPIRDRVRELRRVRASELRSNPRNWRKHPDAQQAALRGVLDEIGFAGALIARECEDGRLELIDGHLRVSTLPDTEVPVLVVDLSAAEAELLLAVHDPLAAMAETDADVLRDILSTIEIRNEAVSDMLDEVLRESQSLRLELDSPDRNATTEVTARTSLELRDSFQVLVECADETEQRLVYERLSQEGRKCRVLTL